MSKINEQQFEIFKMLLQKHLDENKNMLSYELHEGLQQELETNHHKMKIIAAHAKAIIGALEDIEMTYEAFTASRN